MKAAAQLKRRDTYSQISGDRREHLLQIRRLKRQDPAKYSLQNSSVVVPEKSTSSACKPKLPKQTALTIRELPPLLQKVVELQPCVGTSHDNLKKGKHICSPFVIHQSGEHAAHLQGHCLAAQNALPIDSSAIATTTALPFTFARQKNITSSFCVYEVGSTSSTANTECDMP